LHWATFRGYRLPVSAQDGPHDTGGGLASSYTDTPLGALLAIINVGARTAWQFGPDVFQPTIQAQVTGPYQAQMLSSDQDAFASGAARIPDVRAYATIPAFQWVGYTPSDATVDLVAAGPDGNGGTVYVATQIQAQWLNGDWRIVARPAATGATRRSRSRRSMATSPSLDRSDHGALRHDHRPALQARQPCRPLIGNQVSGAGIRCRRGLHRHAGERGYATL